MLVLNLGLPYPTLPLPSLGYRRLLSLASLRFRGLWKLGLVQLFPMCWRQTRSPDRTHALRIYASLSLSYYGSFFSLAWTVACPRHSLGRT